MDRRANMCMHIVPVYYGERPAITRGKPNESKDYYFKCYHSCTPEGCGYRQASNIEDLCNGCKKYNYIKPLTIEEIKDKYYGGKSREAMVVTKSGWYFKTL